MRSTDLNKLLEGESIDWEKISSWLVDGTQSGVGKNTSSLLLTTIVKKKNPPISVLRLLLPSVKLKTLRTAFKGACLNRNVGNGIKELLIEEMNPTPSMSQALLLTAMKCNSEEAVNIIIERSVDFLSPDFYYNTFHEEDVFEELCEILIDRDLVHRDLIFNSQALHAAAYRGHERLTDLILDKYPDALTLKDNNGDLPLHCACDNGNFEIARTLLKKGLDTNKFKRTSVGGLLIPNKTLKSALRIACGSGADADRISDVANWLNEVDPSILSKSKVVEDVNLAHVIARHGDVASMEKMISKDNPSAILYKDQFGKTPLTIACENGHFEVASILYENARMQKGTNHVNLISDAIGTALRAGLNPDLLVIFAEKNCIGSALLQDLNILHHVAGTGSVPYASILLDRSPVLLSSKDSSGSLPIHWACREQNLEMIGHLLYKSSALFDFEYEYGGLLIPDAEGITALHSLLLAFDELGDDAISVSNCISMCLEAIPDLPILHFALQKLTLDADIMLGIMEYSHLDPTCTWEKGKTSVHCALDAFAGRHDNDIEILLDALLSQRRDNMHKKCVHIKDDEGRLPLHYALALGLTYDPCIKKLIDCNFLALAEPCSKTSLLPFMLSAVGPSSDLNTVFRILRSNPAF